jgi:hypothetical protein
VTSVQQGEVGNGAGGLLRGRPKATLVEVGAEMLCMGVCPRSGEAWAISSVKSLLERARSAGLPSLDALNFVLHGAPGGGVTRSLALDANGKCLGSAILDLEILDDDGPTD